MKVKIITLIMVFLYLATACGQQFTNVVLTANPSEQSETGITINPQNNNNLIAVWNDFRSNTFSQPGYAYSTDAGNTWHDNVISSTGGYLYGFDPSISFDRNGNAFYCYVASQGNLGPIYISKSSDNGVTWLSSNQHQVSSLSIKQDKPYITIDNSGGQYDGRIYVSWTDFSNGSAIKVAYSVDHVYWFSRKWNLSLIK